MHSSNHPTSPISYLTVAVMSVARERRAWTAEEDQQLRDAVAKEDPNTQNPSKWHAIAKHVTDRTNKDCRKRWFAKMASDVVKGGWAPDEDERLVSAIDRHGTRWSIVSSLVGTRNSDQCAKRWTDTLNPAIDRTSWTPEADALLLDAVNDYGKLWTKIVKTFFPGRTGLAAKNRYNSITRFSTQRERRASVAGSTSSSTGSSSAGESPVTPHLSVAAPLPSSKMMGYEDQSLWGDIDAYSRGHSTAFPDDALVGYGSHARYNDSVSSAVPAFPRTSIGYQFAQTPMAPQPILDRRALAVQYGWSAASWDNTPRDAYTQQPMY